MFLTIYVDGMLLIGANEDIEAIAASLKSRFAIKDMGNVRFLLGIEINYHPHQSISFCQSKYIEDILKKFRMDISSAVGVPLNENSEMGLGVEATICVRGACGEIQGACGVRGVCDESQGTCVDENELLSLPRMSLPYCSVVGCLQYLVSGSRPELATSV